ncbi:MAG: nuclear transport factor 2 family protein [Actinomycetota bacterium]|nr:nuclear transport factor 2 family protein [Actinomycetota bacterium]
MSEMSRALEPGDLTRLFVDRANAGDAAGIAELYEEQAVMAYPPGAQTIGREAIRQLWEKVLSSRPHFEQETPLPALVSGDIALTATVARDGAGGRAQVVRRQEDGTWLRLLDLPEIVSPPSERAGA